MKHTTLMALSWAATILLSQTAEARYFLGREARFLSPDRAGMIDGPNTYQYAQGNPTQFTDPTGKFSVPGFNVDWWSPGGSEWRELRDIYVDVLVNDHWKYAISYDRVLPRILGGDFSGCDSHARELARAIRRRAPRYFSVVEVGVSVLPPPAPDFPVHLEVMLVPIPRTRFGRVMADTYLWPAMNELDPDDLRYIRDEY